MAQAQTTEDGRRDFDFLFGRRRIHNRKLVDTLDLDCTDWVEFEAEGEARPILAGLGNVDRFSVQLTLLCPFGTGAAHPFCAEPRTDYFNLFAHDFVRVALLRFLGRLRQRRRCSCDHDNKAQAGPKRTHGDLLH